MVLVKKLIALLLLAGLLTVTGIGCSSGGTGSGKGSSTGSSTGSK
jgi:hypothetical protein